MTLKFRFCGRYIPAGKDDFGFLAFPYFVEEKFYG
jgi:hypothetical protein